MTCGTSELSMTCGTAVCKTQRLLNRKAEPSTEMNLNLKLPANLEESSNYCKNRKFSLKDISKCIPSTMMDIYSKLKELDNKSRQDLHSFLITGEFEDNSVTGDNVWQYLDIAQTLQYGTLVDICEEVLLQNLYKQSALSMFIQGTAYNLQRLRKEAIALIEINIDSLCDSDEIQHLGPNDLFDLLCDTSIKTSSFAMKAVNHWYIYEPEPREIAHKKMVEYLQQIQARIRPLEAHPSESLVYQIMFSGSCSVNNNGDGLPIHVFEPRNNWQRRYELQELKNVGSGFAVCCLQHSEDDVPHIYISGGSHSPNTVYHCDVIMNKRKKCSKKLNFGRSLHCMETIGESMFVVGGSCHGENVGAIEEFNGKRHSWKIVGNLYCPVNSATCSVYNNELYIVGGMQQNGKKTNLIQKFSPKTGKSSVAGHLPFPVSNAKSVIFDDVIYVVSENGKFVSFNPQTGSSKLCPSLETNCQDFSIFTEKDGIYVSGGVENKNKTRGIYRYVPDQTVWQQAEYNLKCPLPVTACCAVIIPANFGFVPFLH